jgi:hypothetical protein
VQAGKIAVFVKSDFQYAWLEAGFTHDVRNINHFGAVIWKSPSAQMTILSIPIC